MITNPIPLDEVAPDLAAFAAVARRRISTWEPAPCPPATHQDRPERTWPVRGQDGDAIYGDQLPRRWFR